jgi:uncharacterized protein GlcG (DUF336 family)
MPSLIQLRSLSRELARIGIERALADATALGCRACIAVVDAAGHLVSYDRMDGAPFQSARHAQDKALSAAGNGLSTEDMWAYVADDAQLRQGVLKIEGLSILGGGVPIHINGELVGAVGVSGSCGMPEDQAVAASAVAAILEALGDAGVGAPPGPH